MLPVQLSGSSSAGSGDFFTTTNQTFGGAGSPFPASGGISTVLMIALAALAFVLILPKLRGR